MRDIKSYPRWRVLLWRILHPVTHYRLKRFFRMTNTPAVQKLLTEEVFKPNLELWNMSKRNKLKEG
jgi:hypothetical protein